MSALQYEIYNPCCVLLLVAYRRIISTPKRMNLDYVICRPNRKVLYVNKKGNPESKNKGGR